MKNFSQDTKSAKQIHSGLLRKPHRRAVQTGIPLPRVGTIKHASLDFIGFFHFSLNLKIAFKTSCLYLEPRQLRRHGLAGA
jgi:hypothetical protein